MRDFLCPSLIGRDVEMAALHKAVQDAATSRGSATFLVGEAGIGKSRLVRELVDAARGDSVPVLLGRATPSSETVAFRPLVEALFSRFRDEDLPEVPELEPFRGSLARLVPHWGRGETVTSDGSIVLLAEALLRLLRLVGRQSGCAFVLEDLHWADPETLSIVEYLSENLAAEPVLLLCTVRSGERGTAGDLVDALAARRAARVLDLRRLDASATVEMARACMGATVLPDQVQLLLEASADGLPFFVEELLASAVDAGALVQGTDGWTVRGRIAAQVPRTFVDSVHRRLESLGGSAAVLVTAAVLGRRFEWSLLADVTAESREFVLGALRSGVEAQLLVAEAPATGSFHFRHALTRDAIVDRLLPIERSEIAGRGLKAILEAHRDLPGEWCDLGASLAEQAGDPRAAELLVESGRRSLASGALASAEDAFERARDLAGDPEIRADALEAWCETLTLAGKIDPALDLAQDVVLALHVVAAPPLRVGRVHSRLAGAAAAATRFEAADHHLERARRHASKSTDPALSAWVDVTAAQIAYGRGALEEADRLASDVLTTARDSELPDLVCEALLLIGHCGRVSDTSRAAEAYRETAALAAEHGLELLRIRALFEIGTLSFLALGSSDDLHAARELASSTGALAIVAQIDLHLAALATLQGDLDTSIPAARRASDAARRLRMPDLCAHALIAEAAGHVRLGRAAQAEELIAEAVSQAGESASAGALLWGHCRAEPALVDEDRARALAALDTMADLVREQPGSATMPHRGLWALLRALEGIEGIEADAACSEVRNSGATAQHLNLGHLLYADAVLAGRAGDRAEALRLVGAADAVLANASWYRHLGRRLVAEAAIVDGWGEPAPWLREALPHFERAGQDRLAAACRSLLKKAGAPVPRQRADDGVPVVLRERGITEREDQVLVLLAEGLGNNEIAARLFLSPRTVERHVANLTAKTDLRTRTELVAFAARVDRP